MIRDQCILVRPDGSVMFDSPASQAKHAAESRDAWHERTVTKAIAQQTTRGAQLIRHDRIAPEERPDPKVRNAIRINRLTGKLEVPLETARMLLAQRWHGEASYLMRRLKAEAEAAQWFPLLDAPAWETKLLVVQSESRRLSDELRLARSVQDLLAIEPVWPVIEGAQP